MAQSHNDVKFLHFRQIDERGNVNPRGGVTVAYRAGSTNAIYYGAARCSEDDNFEKQQGRTLSSARLAAMAYPDTGVVMGTDDEKEFALYMEGFIKQSFGYVRKFSRKNRKHA